MEMLKENIKPLLKWTGGKYEEYKAFKHYIPSFQRYYEPFFGGGGVFFALQPKGDCFLNDVSHDLIQFYTHIPHPRFQNELWRYVLAWEQSRVLGTDVGKKLLPIVARYMAGTVSDTKVSEKIKSAVQTIAYASYTPLVTTSFVIDKKTYIQHLIQSVTDKCRRLKILAEKEHHTITRGKVLQQIETAVQAGFYAHVRHLHNHYATQNNHLH